MEESDDSSLNEFQGNQTQLRKNVSSGQEAKEGQDGGGKRRRGRAIEWKILQSDLKDHEAVLAFINEGETRWRANRAHKTSEGDKVYYKCQIRGCSRQLLAVYHSNKMTASVLTNGVEHSHAEGQNPDTCDDKENHGLKPSAKKAVDILYQSGIQKPLTVYRRLREQGMEASYKKVVNYIRTLKRKKYGNATMNFAELRGWCSSHSEAPADDNEAYVVDWMSDPDQGRFRVQFTSRTLLRLASKSDVVHVDATYKLNWNGYPVLITGVSDRQGKFFPTMCSVMTSETAEDYGALLLCMKEAVERETNIDFCPRVVVADCSEAISNAVRAVFPQALRRSCWFHVKKAVESRLRSAPEHIRRTFLQDLSNLQVCCSAEEFRWFGAKMVEKWRREWVSEEGEKFCTYFWSMFMERFCVWSEGHDLASPSTNNGLEAFNGEIKKQHTMRERLPVGQFLVLSLTIVRHWSLDCGTRRVFSESLSISLDLSTRAYQWTNSGKALISEDGSYRKIYVPADKSTEITADDLTSYKAVVEEGVGTCESFDTFVQRKSKVWVVSDEGDGTDVWNLRCTCPPYMKGNVCKHVVGVAYFLNMLPIPEAAKAIEIGQRRKRGRPSKAKMALQRQ